MNSTVGASILSTITESLYDKPIVVFREYIQNSVDAFDNTISNEDDFSARIWTDANNLFFLDNGTGIQSELFQQKMIEIANSEKKRMQNLGYKGIGRLSGLPYCQKLSFINIVDYSDRVFQKYVIDGERYDIVRKSDNNNDLDFRGLMSQIGTLIEKPVAEDILTLISNQTDLFAKRNTGFLVVLEGITTVLKNVILNDLFLDNLGWLLPVPFRPELLQPFNDEDTHGLFAELQSSPLTNNDRIPAKAFHICYNGDRIFRPLTPSMLRTYVCKSNLNQYAICVHTFSNERIELNRRNQFSGIRVYIDNMLLCDENEIVPVLQQYGIIKQGGTYEVIQSVRGIGAMIFIVDKFNIYPNARRTFINVTDYDSIKFLELIGEFIDIIFKARYALSAYYSAKRKEDIGRDKLENLKNAALSSLKDLAKEEIELQKDEDPISFDLLPKEEQKRIIKSIITGEFSKHINKYLSQLEEYNRDTCFNDFKTWLSAN